MVWIVLAALAASFGAAFGLIAGAARMRGAPAARRMAIALAAIFAVGGALAYSAYLQQTDGSFPPDHFYNTVLGQIVVVGGLLASVGGMIGAIAAYMTLRRARD